MRAALLWAEARQAWRGLLRKPAYLALASLTLALGVGTVSLVFSLLDQALLKPLAFPEADRLVVAGMHNDGDAMSAAPGMYGPIKSVKSLVSSGMAMGWARNVNVSGDGQAQVVSALYADGGFLRTLGRPMALGRNFNADEDRPHGPQGVILSHDFWQGRFGGDRAVLGRTLEVEGKPAVVIGVLPAGFEWNTVFDMILPLQPDLAERDLSNNQYIVARLAPGASLAGANAEAGARLRAAVDAQSATMSTEGREYWRHVRLGVGDLKQFIFSSGRDTLQLFLGAALCVLVIAAVNLANLMLLRALARSHDGAVRVAMGAPWLRLALPSLAEGLLIGLLGGVMGLLLAWLGLRMLEAWVPPEWMRAQALQLSVTTVVFALAVALLVAVLAACIGVWRASRQTLVTELVGGGRSGLSRESGQLGRVLVVLQLAVAVVLLSGAALFLRSLQQLAQVPMGFESRAITTFSLAPVLERAPDILAVNRQTRRILDGLEAQPGVTGAVASTNLPTGSQLNISMQFPDGRQTSVQYRPVTPGFLQVFGIPLLAGRAFDPQRDVAGGEVVCLVGATFVRDYLHGGSAIGQVVQLPDDGHGRPFPMRIVGVVGDVRQAGPAEPAPGVLYVPLEQMPASMWNVVRGSQPLSYAVSVRPGHLGQIQHDLQRIVERVAPGQPIGDIKPLEQVVASTTSRQKLNLLLVGVFAGLALLLAAVGLYAVTAVTVASRTAEFGVRAAMGASPGRLARQVLGECARQVALGLCIGLVAALSLSRLVQHFLYGVGAADPLAIGVVLVVLALAAALASLVPALRAARVPPMQALRA
jgi:putative ABC transport system permease protein